MQLLERQKCSTASGKLIVCDTLPPLAFWTGANQSTSDLWTLAVSRGCRWGQLSTDWRWTHRPTDSPSLQSRHWHDRTRSAHVQIIATCCLTRIVPSQKCRRRPSQVMSTQFDRRRSLVCQAKRPRLSNWVDNSLRTCDDRPPEFGTEFQKKVVLFLEIRKYAGKTQRKTSRRKPPWQQPTRSVQPSPQNSDSWQTQTDTQTPGRQTTDTALYSWALRDLNDASFLRATNAVRVD